MRPQVRSRSSLAASRSETPMVTARTSRLSLSIMRSTSRTSVASKRKGPAGMGRLYSAAPMSSFDSPEVPLRAAVVAIQLPDTDDAAFAASVAELHRLATTLGVQVVASVTQRRQSLHPAAVIGSGKLAELVAMTG